MITTLSREDRIAIRTLAGRGLSPAAIARQLELPEFLVAAGLRAPRRQESTAMDHLTRLFFSL